MLVSIIVSARLLSAPPRKAFFWFGFMLGDPHTRVGIPGDR